MAEAKHLSCVSVVDNTIPSLTLSEICKTKAEREEDDVLI